MGDPKKKSKHLSLKSTILDNEKLNGTALYKTVAELATEYEVTPSTIYLLRHRLGLARAPGIQQRSSVTQQTLLPAATTTEGLLKILEDEPLLTANDRLKILSRLIRTGAPAVKIAAIKTYEDLTRVTVEHVGPPDPFNDDEASARLARLLMAVGQKVADMAYDTAFGDTDETQGPETPLQPDPTPSPMDAPAPALPLLDLPPEDEEPTS